ncbi:hypothetical protein ACQJBY_009327 [Aegilops geniculata]
MKYFRGRLPASLPARRPEIPIFVQISKICRRFVEPKQQNPQIRPLPPLLPSLNFPLKLKSSGLLPPSDLRYKYPWILPSLRQHHPSYLPAWYHQPPIRRASARMSSKMAADSGDQENLPPSTTPPTATAAVVRPRHFGVKKGQMKRLGRARRRAPLKDITNHFAVETASAEVQALQQPEGGSEGDTAKEEPAAQTNALASAAAVKARRNSLRKEFR